MLKYEFPAEYIKAVLTGLVELPTNNTITKDNNSVFNKNISAAVNLKEGKKLDIIYIKTSGNFDRVNISKESELPHYMKSFRNMESFYDNMDTFITHQEYLYPGLIFEVLEFETENKLVIFTAII